MTTAQSHSVAHRALRIGIDQQGLETAACEGHGKIHRGGGLTDPTFLADDGEDAPHVQYSSRRGSSAGACQ